MALAEKEKAITDCALLKHEIDQLNKKLEPLIEFWEENHQIEPLAEEPALEKKHSEIDFSQFEDEAPAPVELRNPTAPESEISSRARTNPRHYA